MHTETSNEVLAQVLELLQRQGWASYRTLRRRFGLDEAALAALIPALTATQPVTVDATGTRLVWQGELWPAAAPTRTWDVVPSTPSMGGAAPQPRGGERRRGGAPLVGREQEMALLRACWAQVQAGQGQVVALSGEAGIGKSRLVQVVSAHVAETLHRQWVCRGVPTAQYSAFAPVIDLLQQVLDYQPDDGPAVKRYKLETTLATSPLALPEAIPLLAALLTVPLEDRYAPLTLTPERQRQRTLETVLTVLRRLAVPQPMVLVVEDLHWVDPSTLELLSRLVAQAATARLYVLLTWRPEFQPPWSPPAHQTTLTLGRLLPAQVEQLATYVAEGKTLPPAVLAQIVAKTEGVPLFVEELTQMVLASGLLRAEAERYELTGPLPPLAIPLTVHDSMVARLEQLGAAKVVAQVGAVWGRGFTEAQIQAVAPLERRQLDQALARLVAADMLREVSLPPRLTYVFKHALLQEAAYASLPPEQRQQVHGQVAQVLVAQFPETVTTQPELLAHHYTAAGLPTQAIPYWQRAGERAVERSAYVEAISHLHKGLELLSTLPTTAERLRQELDMQMTLGPALMATQGHGASDTARAYSRARALCQQVQETPQLFPVLWGLWRFALVRAELQSAWELGQQLLTLAQRQPDPAPLLVAHQALGTVLCFLGEFPQARAHLEPGLTVSDPAQERALAVRYSIAPGVWCRSYAAHALWFLGYPDEALRRSYEACTLAQGLEHPQSRTYAQCFVIQLHLLRGEAHAAHAQAEALIILAVEQQLAYWMAVGLFFQGVALAAQGQGEAGVAQVRQGLTGILATGAVMVRSQYLAMLAEAYGKMRQANEALHVLAQAQAAVAESGRRDYEAEIYRLQGECLLRQAASDTAQAEACFQQALAIAHRQQAKAWELRAAMSLSRLWQHQGKRAEAYALLAEVYGWFTEGFDTADLQEAKALLDALA
jgi:predicted ATPase